MNNSAEITQLALEVAGLLAKTLEPDRAVRRAAEDELAKLETSSKVYGLATLQLTLREDLTRQVHTSAAIAFKNFIRRNWRYDPNDETSDQIDKIDGQQRELIKSYIINFMIKSPNHIQRQLSEAITIIGQCDFPQKWPSLIVDLEKSLKEDTDQSFNSTQGILQTAHSIFRRYRHELQSDNLWREIKLVIEHFGVPLTEKFKNLVAATKTSQDPAHITPLYQSLLLCAKIYLSLVTQDLPELFEDRLNEWMPLFLELLDTQMKLCDSSVIEDMKAEICEIASLFVQRYSDAENFDQYTQKFSQSIWNLLVTTSQDMKYDTLVSTAIRFLVTVANRPESRPLFQDSNVLNLLCQKVIIPNLSLREIDEELFEDDPEEYVKRDMEGSDVDTRRRAACDLVQALSRFLEVQMIEIFGRYIEEMLNSYNSNKTANWKHKDLAIFLYTSMANKGSTRHYGTVSVSQHVNVESFFEEKIVDELVNESSQTGFQILKADALRYITSFRNQISLPTLISRIPLIVKHITSNNVVVRTYASIALERLLMMKEPGSSNVTALKPEQFEPYMGELVKTLFVALELPGSPENEYIMMSIMRLFSFSRSTHIVPFLPVVVPKITSKLALVAKNPSKPYFNHYLFETLALTIRAACSEKEPMMRNEFENVLFSILETVLAQDVQEFTPYVLQLLNLILRAQPIGAISEKFSKLFNELLSPTLWEKPANVKPLTELMHTYVEKIGPVIISENKFIPLLGVFQKLIASKATDHEGLALLETIIIHMPAPEVDARIRDIFMLIFQRLTGSKTTKFVKNVLVTFSLYAFVRGADQLASAVNQLQDRLFGMVLEKLYLTDVKKETGRDRRICMCGLIKILAQLPLMDNGAYNSLWAPLLLTLMEMFEMPQHVEDQGDEEHFVDVAESLDFQAQYSRLNYASVKRDDPTKEIGDLRSLLANSLSGLSVKLPGVVNKLSMSLDPGVLACLMTYCHAANVTLS